MFSIKELGKLSQLVVNWQHLLLYFITQSLIAFIAAFTVQATGSYYGALIYVWGNLAKQSENKIQNDISNTPKIEGPVLIEFHADSEKDDDDYSL
ncbi:Aquaporin-8 [Dirofilaria immitis]